MKNRIHYDALELIRATEQALDDLKEFRFNPRYRLLLGEAILEKMGEWDKSIRDRKDDPLTIVVCGEFKRGKSSLINALLREEVVTTNVTTETVTLNRIRYGAHSNAAILPMSRRMTLSDEEMQRAKLEALIQDAGEPIDQLELTRPIELLKNITIVDTPGLNDALQDFSPLVEDALQQADAVIYVCSVEAPLSQKEQLFLRLMVLPQKYTDLFIVGNYADIIRERDYDRVHAFLNERVSTFMPAQDVLMLSALDEICRTNGYDRPNPQTQDRLGENFDAFRSRLDELLTLKKDTILPDRIHRLTRGMIRDLEKELAVMEEGLSLDVEQAHARSEASKNEGIQQREQERAYLREVSGRIEHMKNDARGWIRILLDDMCAELDTLNDVPVEDIKKFYSSYCIDTIQEAIDHCREYHLEKLYSELDEEGGKAVSSLSLTETQYGFRFIVNNKTWTRGDNVGYIASKLPSFGLLSLVVDGVAGSMRNKETASQKSNLIQEIKSQYGPFRVSAEKAIDEIYDSINASIQGQLTDYFANQAQEKERQNEELVRVAAQTEARKDEIRGAIAELKDKLNRLK